MFDILVFYRTHFVHEVIFVSTCMDIALDNASACVGYKLAFCKYNYV